MTHKSILGMVKVLGRFIASVVLACCTAAAADATRPNIVFLLADDLGGGDLHCYRHPYSRTPHIDSLARDGTRFTQFYATGPTCCPARTGLMTSRFPATFPVYPAKGGFADRVTVTELLKKHGYATGHFGKWHIGPDPSPGTYGIDEINSGGDTKNKRSSQRQDPRGRDAGIYDDAIAFIERHKETPFYVNVWGHISHHTVDPVEPLVERWRGLKVDEKDFPPPMQAKFQAVRTAGGDVDDAMRRYLADVESLDDSVGRLLARLDALGLRENTIVVFNTDQGASMKEVDRGGTRMNLMGSNGPYRGGKHTHLEGGIRVPWIVRWPGHVPAGRVDHDSVLSGVDWLPTLCSIAGIATNPDDFHGEDTSAAWLGNVPHVRTKPLFWRTSNPRAESFIREGPWKLRQPGRKNDGAVELYNIANDPTESTNLTNKRPEIVERLAPQLAAWVTSLPKDYVKTDDKED
jgi:N-acetylgalactosamine-6-sulfatase